MSFSVNVTPGFLIQTRQQPLQTARRAPGFSIKVFPQWFKSVTLQWTVPASWGHCLFDVYFSQVEDSGFVKLNSTPITGTTFSDTTTQEYSKYKHGYYVVEAILQDRNNAVLRSDPITWHTYQRDWVRLRSMEIQRREYWLLSRFAGIGSYLFRKKTYGMRCTRCWNPTTEQVTDDHCPQCLGTSFQGGFFDPVKIYLQYDPTPNVEVKNYIGHDEENTISAWTISMPDIRLGDILMRTGGWEAYEVTRIQTTELQGNVVRQILTLVQLSKNDVEYQLVTRNLPDFPTQYLEPY